MSTNYVWMEVEILLQQKKTRNFNKANFNQANLNQANFKQANFEQEKI